MFTLALGFGLAEIVTELSDDAVGGLQILLGTLQLRLDLVDLGVSFLLDFFQFALIGPRIGSEDRVLGFEFFILGHPVSAGGVGKSHKATHYHTEDQIEKNQNFP